MIMWLLFLKCVFEQTNKWKFGEKLGEDLTSLTEMKNYGQIHKMDYMLSVNVKLS